MPLRNRDIAASSNILALHSFILVEAFIAVFYHFIRDLLLNDPY